MHIAQVKEEISTEELKKRCDDLMEALPHLHFPQWINFWNGEINGYWSKSWHGRPRVTVFYNFNLAVIDKKMTRKEESVAALQGLGYRVAAEESCYHGLCFRNIVSPEKVLWDELRRGEGIGIIKENLVSLLTPLFTSIKGAKEFEFGVYNPSVVTSTDDVIPPYIEYDEIFRLPVAGNGLVDWDKLVEKVRKMPHKRALAISSRVKTDEERHIPLIDFKTDGEVYPSDIKAALGRLDLPERIIVNSGNSFHHHNPRELMSDRRFNSYLECIAQQPEIGENWPWFQAFQGFALLRITPCSYKPFFPEPLRD